MIDHLPSDAPATYAIGDLHGEVTLLCQLIAALPLRDQDTLVFLSDYLDRGEDSAATVATLRAVVRRSQSCAMTMSNDA